MTIALYANELLPNEIPLKFHFCKFRLKDDLKCNLVTDCAPWKRWSNSNDAFAKKEIKM